MLVFVFSSHTLETWHEIQLAYHICMCRAEGVHAHTMVNVLSVRLHAHAGCCLLCSLFVLRVYGIRLRYPDLPCVDAKASNRKCYIPLELLL